MTDAGLPQRAAGGLLLALLASGCFNVSGSFGERIPFEQVSRIEPGRTTRQEIVSWFGPPAAFARPGLLDLILANGEGVEPPRARVVEDVYSYRYVESQVRVLVVPLFMLRGRAKTMAESLTVFFDGEGRVRYYGYRRDEPGATIGEVPGG